MTKAISLKLKSIAFTEHVNKNTDWFDDFKKRIDALKNNKHIKIFFGIEAGTVDFNGTLNATQEIIRKSDIVLGVVHRYPNGRGGLIALNETKDLGQDKAAEVEFKLALALLSNKNVDVLGHPFGVYSKFFNRFPEGYMKELLIESLKKDKSVKLTRNIFLKKIGFLNYSRRLTLMCQ